MIFSSYFYFSKRTSAARQVSDNSDCTFNGREEKHDHDNLRPVKPNTIINLLIVSYRDTC